MPLPIKRSISIETGTVLKVVSMFLALGFLYLIRDILALVFVALFLAALMHPAAHALARRRIPKGVTVISFYLLLFGLMALAVGLLLPTVIDQSSQLIGSLGKSFEMVSGSIQTLKDFSTTHGLQGNVQASVQSFGLQAAKAASGLFSTLAEVVGGFIGLIVILVMAYYMVVQEEEARKMFHHFVPDEYKELTTAIIKRVEEKISRWLLGQLSLCVIIGILYFIGLSVIGVNAALVLALFGGFTEFIPYLGPILGAIPVFVIAFTESPMKAALAIGVIIIIQQLEGHIIVPKIMQRVVGLNPIVSIVALLVGAKLFGLVGALLAIPVATASSAVLTELYYFHQRKAAP
ncbi:MAG: AI-2E family transporter [Patescibacteria group bacterium]